MTRGASKVLVTADKLASSPPTAPASPRKGTTTTVRVLRARPAFYPVVRDPYLHRSSHGHHTAHGAHVHRTRARTAAAHAAAASILSMDDSQLLQLSQDSGRVKQMTLRTAADRSSEIKKKRRSAKTPTTINL